MGYYSQIRYKNDKINLTKNIIIGGGKDKDHIKISHYIRSKGGI